MSYWSCVVKARAPVRHLFHFPEQKKEPDTGLIGFTVFTSVGNLTGRDHLHNIQPEKARGVRSIPVWVFRSLTIPFRLSVGSLPLGVIDSPGGRIFQLPS